MKYRFRIIFGFLALLLTLAGCVRELIPQNNGYKPKVVIWALLNTDSSIRFVTSGNRGVDPEDQVSYKNCDLFLYENGVKVKTLFSKNIESDPGHWDFEVQAKAGKEYSVKILGNGVDLSGSTRVLDTIGLVKMELGVGESAIFNYTVDDPESSEDAYQFEVGLYHRGQLLDTASGAVIDPSFLLKNTYEQYDEPVINYKLPLFSEIETGTLTFPVNDLLFNGKKKTFSFTVKNPASGVFMIGRPGSSGLVYDKLVSKEQFLLVRCRKVSSDYYRFIRSDYTNTSIFGTPYFNPTNVYSNVSGGLGLVAAYSERTDTLWIRK